MNLRERCQTVFKAGYQLGKTSFRSWAQKNNLSKSSVHRLYHRIKRRVQSKTVAAIPMRLRIGIAPTKQTKRFSMKAKDRNYL